MSGRPRPPRPPRPVSAKSRLFVTDLDATLLDEETYSFAPALPALAALKRSGSRLVLASSKTRAEMEPLARELGLDSPLIVENGGAVLLPRADGGYDPMVIGSERALLIRSLAEIGHEVGAAVSGFSTLTPEAVARLTNLTIEAAGRALERSYDEPFVLEDDSAAAALAAAAARRGLRVTRGGRFFHLTGATDKGRAFRHLLSVLERDGRRFETVGLGDAKNDLPLLQVVDRPIVVPRRDGRLDRELVRQLPGAERAPAPGPVGWNLAVLAILAERRLPAAAAESD